VVAGPLTHLRRLVRDGGSDAPGRVVDALGRVGLVGYGLVHLLVAWLALQVAFGVSDAPADPDGAIGTVARTPGGFASLTLGVVGLAAFAIWQLSAAAVGFRWVRGGERFRKRVGATAKAIATAGLALVVLDYLLGVRRPGGDNTARRLAGELLALPAGRLLLGAAVVVIFFLAGAMTYTGVKRTFLGDLDLRHVGPVARAAVEWLGVAGHLARALALAVIGVLAAMAALSADPARAGGLDAALRTIGSSAAGAGLLVVVAAGIAAFGLFCMADAATRRA
jgi:hypothetical protein